MVRLVSDENFTGSIIRGIWRHHPEIDLVRVQDVGLRGADDRTILEWAAQEDRVLLTHDLKTIPDLVAERLSAGRPVAGVCFLSHRLTVARAIEEIAIAVHCLADHEWKDNTVHLPI